jgi:predicted dehydrogenase
MPARLRLGLVGVGPVVERYHLRAVRGVPEVEPVPVVDINEERACQFALRQGLLFATTRLQDLFRKVDLAILGLPNGLHASVALSFFLTASTFSVKSPWPEMSRNARP